MILKRLFDLYFSLCVLLLLAPVLVGVALWIKLDSRGPVLFRQQRVGRQGRLFNILKFRTMRSGSKQGGPQITIGDDPRITRAGRFLRRYKLDELPQFVNVLLGEMSVVGPRPEVPTYIAHYPPTARELILSVRPGITDPASIAFRDESALLASAADPEAFYVEEILPAKVKHCLAYVQNRSFRLDMLIVWRTALALLRRDSSEFSNGA